MPKILLNEPKNCRKESNVKILNRMDLLAIVIDWSAKTRHRGDDL